MLGTATGMPDSTGAVGALKEISSLISSSDSLEELEPDLLGELEPDLLGELEPDLLEELSSEEEDSATIADAGTAESWVVSVGGTGGAPSGTACASSSELLDEEEPDSLAGTTTASGAGAAASAGVAGDTSSISMKSLPSSFGGGEGARELELEEDSSEISESPSSDMGSSGLKRCTTWSGRRSSARFQVSSIMLATATMFMMLA